MRLTIILAASALTAGTLGTAAAKNGKTYHEVRRASWTLKRTKQEFGAPPSKAAYDKVKQHGCAGDAAGHIRANSMGGSGKPNNIFPQDPSTNSGDFNQWEQSIIELLNHQEKRQYVFDSLRINVRFKFDRKSIKPKRPTKVSYCYRGRRLDPESGKRKTVRKCRSFANPFPESCKKDPDFEALIKRTNEHIEAAREARRTALDLEDSFLKRACRRDFERLGDAEWRAADTDYKNTVQAKTESRFKQLERENNAWKRELQNYVRRPGFKKRARGKVADLDAGHKTLLAARKGEFRAAGSLRFRAARKFNVGQHKALQKRMGCATRGDGDVVADCRVDKAKMRGIDDCTFYELAPHNHPRKGALRARAQKRARAFNRKTRGKDFAGVGNNCEGKFKSKLKLYRACQFGTGGSAKTKRKPAAKRKSRTRGKAKLSRKRRLHLLNGNKRRRIRRRKTPREQRLPDRWLKP